MIDPSFNSSFKQSISRAFSEKNHNSHPVVANDYFLPLVYHLDSVGSVHLLTTLILQEQISTLFGVAHVEVNCARHLACWTTKSVSLIVIEWTFLDQVWPKYVFYGAFLVH